MKITFIQTGGTIDKDYPHTTKGWAFEFGEPATNRILEKLDPSFEYNVITSCQKDSLEITDKDRQELVKLINKQTDSKFIITHGTDTMIETATFLAAHIKDKLIVITGAMRPERFSNSDAETNLGCAIATANLKEKGIFIAMHGIVKAHDEIKGIWKPVNIINMEKILTPNMPKSNGHYSQCIKHNGILYLSGQLPLDPETKIIPKSIEEQANLALKNVELILIEAGSSKNNILQMRVYISDIKLWDKVNERYSIFFGDHKPVRSIIPTRDLHFGCLIEIEATAIVG